MTTASLKLSKKAWYKSAANNSRKRLFPAGLASFLAGLLLWLLWLMVPTKTLQHQLGAAKQSDALTIAYMKTWILADPTDSDMRFLLARHLFIAGRYDEGLKLAELLITEARTAPNKVELLHNTQLLKLSVIEARAFAVEASDPRRAELLNEARTWLATMVASTNDKIMLGAYLRRSMALDDLALTKQVLAKINPGRYRKDPSVAAAVQSEPAISALESEVDTLNPQDGEIQRTVRDLLNTPEARGRDAVANGRWQEAADIYWGMYDHSRNPKARKDLLLLLVRNEQWGNRLTQFFTALDTRLVGLPTDRELLKKLAKLALAANRLDIAEKFVRQLMQFSELKAIPTLLLEALSRLNPISSAYAADPNDKGTAKDDAKWIAHTTQRDWETSATSIKREEPPLPKATFDDEAFLIAYQVFMAKANQEDAYKVAALAVKQMPKHGEWRHRLAQVAEWTQRPDEALLHWHYLAQNFAEVSTPTKDSKNPLTLDLAWSNVKRLAAALNHLPSLILALEYEQNLRPKDLELDRAILRIEEKLGKTEHAISRLQKRIKALGAPHHRDLLEELLALASRLHNADLLLETATQINSSYGQDISRAVLVANTHAERGNLQAAFDSLVAVESLARNRSLLSAELDRKIRYWSTLGDYARGLQKAALATEALSQALEIGSAQLTDYEQLASLLEEKSVTQAAAVTFQIFLQDRKMATFKRAAISWLEGDAIQELSTAMDYLSEDQRQELLRSIDFLKARATYFQAHGRFQEALSDYLSAIRIEPESTGLRVGLVWLLIAAKKAPLLDQLLKQWHTVAIKDPAYWGAFGAAHLTLGEPHRALPFFARQARSNDDYLWRMSYADALENAGQPDPAWTLRRKAWTELQKTPNKELYTRPDTRDRVLALALQFAPADSAKKLLASLVKDRELKTTRLNKSPYAVQDGTTGLAGGVAALTSSQVLAESVRRTLRDTSFVGESKSKFLTRDERIERTEERSSASEIALSYLLSKEGLESAQAWLLMRYANALSRPAWANLSVALATQDKAQIARLLDDVSDWLPRYDRVEAMKQVGRTAAAQTSAFETLASRPDNQEAYRSFLSTLSDDVSGASISSASGKFSDLSFHDTTLSAAWRFNQRWTISSLISKGQLNWENPPGLLGTRLPLATQKLSLGVKAVIDKGYVFGNMERHQLLRDFTAFQGEWQAGLAHGWNVNLKLAHHVPASETPALRLAGMKDYMQARVSHQLTGRDLASLSLGAARYLTQAGTSLGSGFNFRLEYSHQIEKLQPGWTLKAELARVQFNRRSGTDKVTDLITPPAYHQPSEFFLPNSYTQADIYLSTSESSRPQGRGPLQPFAQLGLRYNSLTGAGYNLRAGVAGSVLGHDSNLFYVQSSSATPGSSHGSIEIGLKYNYFF
jgi:polysaccharide biosynthesis protein PelB